MYFETRSFWNDEAIDELYKSKSFFKKSIFFMMGMIRRIFHLFMTLKYDTIFVHREVMPIGSPIWIGVVKNIFQKKVIYDFDDAIWIPHHSEKHGFMKFIRRINQTRGQIRFSSLVLAGNDYLKNYALQFNSNTVFMPTVVNTAYHQKHDAAQKEICIGWTGSHSTLEYLNIIAPVLNQLSEKYSFKFLVICDQQPGLSGDFVEYIKWRQNSEIQDLSKIDIGIMPLPEEEWAKGKCAFKAIQYMALGIPVVATRYGANEVVIDDEVNGFTIDANNAKGWLESLGKLIDDEALRLKMGAKGQQKIKEQYALSAYSEAMVNFLQH